MLQSTIARKPIAINHTYSVLRLASGIITSILIITLRGIALALGMLGVLVAFSLGILEDLDALAIDKPELQSQKAFENLCSL